MKYLTVFILLPIFIASEPHCMQNDSSKYEQGTQNGSSQLHAIGNQILLEKPKWFLTNVQDLGQGKQNHTNCVQCGTKIRYVYNIRNEDSSEQKQVGCICAARLIEDIEKIFKWEPRPNEWPINFDDLLLKKVSEKNGKTTSKIYAYVFKRDEFYSYNVKEPSERFFRTMQEAQKAAIEEYLSKTSD